jgi:hypothetical protein
MTAKRNSRRKDKNGEEENKIKIRNLLTEAVEGLQTGRAKTKYSAILL